MYIIVNSAVSAYCSHVYISKYVYLAHTPRHRHKTEPFHRGRSNVPTTAVDSP